MKAKRHIGLQISYYIFEQWERHSGRKLNALLSRPNVAVLLVSAGMCAVRSICLL